MERARRDDGFQWRLGVRPLDLHDWIERGPDADAIIADKARLCQQFPDTVFAVLDDIEPESMNILAGDGPMSTVPESWTRTYIRSTRQHASSPRT